MTANTHATIEDYQFTRTGTGNRSGLLVCRDGIRVGSIHGNRVVDWRFYMDTAAAKVTRYGLVTLVTDDRHNVGTFTDNDAYQFVSKNMGAIHAALQ